MATIAPSSSSYVPFSSATSRTAAVNIAFSAVSLLVGGVLCLCGRRAWRITCAIAVGLAFELIAAAVVFNAIGANGFKSSYSATDNNLAAFAIILGAGIFGFGFSRLLPRKWYIGWWLGWALLGPIAGMSIAMTVIMLGGGDDMLFGSIVGRWILIAGLAIIGLIAVSSTKWTGATLACCIVGSWLLALGVDLILNTNLGVSAGLRKLLDYNALHQEALLPYSPSLSTRLLFGLSWVAALFFFIIQWYLYRERWFLQIRPSDQQRSWKHWLCPFLLRSSFTRPSTPVADEGKMEEAAIVTPPEDDARRSRSLHSRQNSSPDSTATMDADLAERGSLASGSDLRALTQNYRRALEILESEDGHQSQQTEGTVQIPIYYRPAPINLEVSPSPGMQGENTSPASPNGFNDQRTLLKPTSLSRPGLLRTGPSPPLSPLRSPYGQADDQVPDLGAARKRAESDRGTTYSIPLTNITSSEYRDRDMHRPPSWTGDLPWNPSMLRGDLDPATLPRHTPDSPPRAIEALLDHVVPVQPHPSAHLQAPVAQAGPRRPLPVPPQPKGPKLEDEFEMVAEPEGVAHNGKPDLRISHPFQMPYASRPASREESPNPLPSLGAMSRSVPKAQRTPTRERHLFPSEDDLPNHTPATPEGAHFPHIAGHSRLNTSETVVENPIRHRTRDENTTHFDQSEDEEVGPGDTSSHASYSISHFGKKRNRNLATKCKGKSAQKQFTPTDSSESEGDVPLRPITQSDLTPHLQDLPPPTRPTLVQTNHAAVSNHASLTGTPRSSGLYLYGQDQQAPPLPMPRSEMSEATVRPSQEQRRPAETEHLEHSGTTTDDQIDGKKVRFFDSGSRKTLRDKLLRR
ncbi:hypothetical protein P389DRAFT_196470 [Cystobasidium minutum MCA 4210]|uniref:uncharacterized protein n=1 Tax=Cystobasidium minutum MCA 4210 TaxID=1397322 RepID=UPI0034CFAF57|eukprot:jgi/Rhomi1/196470/gm1.4684_g